VPIVRRPRVMTTDLLVFSLGKQHFALPVGQVSTVVPRATLTPLPGAPTDLIGLLRLRGALCPVIDIRARLGLCVGVPHIGECIVVISSYVGLLVEGIVGVVPPPASAAHKRNVDQFIRDVLEVDGHVVATLDAEAIVADDVRAYLAASTNSLHRRSGQAAA
jgi:chemotaxis signal transduction protein